MIAKEIFKKGETVFAIKKINPERCMQDDPRIIITCADITGITWKCCPGGKPALDTYRLGVEGSFDARHVFGTFEEAELFIDQYNTAKNTLSGLE